MSIKEEIAEAEARLAHLRAQQHRQEREGEAYERAAAMLRAATDAVANRAGVIAMSVERGGTVARGYAGICPAFDIEKLEVTTDAGFISIEIQRRR